ncbi:MAG TPA: hypothetical protein VL634_11960 [Mycobacterium sp.]|nr:hypothetical protein [Mycobacterium sp.]
MAASRRLKAEKRANAEPAAVTGIAGSLKMAAPRCDRKPPHLQRSGEAV